MAMIKAIQTEYNGIKFRSRLEAKWAVFFDTAKIRYEYEPEGYETEEGGKYLPDFYLPDFDLYVEVKRDTEEGIKEIVEKCEPAIQWGGAIKQILILSDIPGENPDGERWAFPIIYWLGDRKAWGWMTFWETDIHDEAYTCIRTDMGSSYRALHGGGKIRTKCDFTIKAVSAFSQNHYEREKLRQIERILGYRYEEEVCLTKEEKIERQKEEDFLVCTAFEKARKARFEFGETATKEE
jgi:hypothetical protein